MKLTPRRSRVKDVVAAMVKRSAWLESWLPMHALSSIKPWQAVRRMTAEEQFAFDLQGFLIVREALAADEVAALRALAAEKSPAPADRPAYRREFGPTRWGQPYEALIDHP